MPNHTTLISDTQNISIQELINKGIAYAIIVAGFLSVVFIFIGGISFILSGGQEDKIKQAVSTIRYAIIGLIITILSVIIVNAIGRVIGISTAEYINFSEIVRLIQDISDGFRTNGGGPNTLR
ncbi:hypothetical protein COV82_06005 [Candidatus Peregrinibacteria bacterium CG11_big_fil_rev_8_21_14_0_20_46_8]|nr:MAG: hypothetical protein COV82_06005 [Candidatus Peregrinibacteria bacterium CG11_big_fil_rev_8_21_14_0_20_46_8]